MTCGTLAPNLTKITIQNRTVFFSYETVIMVVIGSMVYTVDRRHSVTTTKHENIVLRYLTDCYVCQQFLYKTVMKEEIEALAEGPTS